jgi:hypothetical protein
MIPERVEDDIKDAFGKFKTMNTAEILKTIFGLLQGVMRAEKEDLIAVWGLLDFFDSEVPEDEKHRIKVIRRTILR